MQFLIFIFNGVLHSTTIRCKRNDNFNEFMKIECFVLNKLLGRFFFLNCDQFKKVKIFMYYIE